MVLFGFAIRDPPPPKSFQKVPKVLFSFCQKHPPPLWYFLGYVPVRKVPTPPVECTTVLSVHYIPSVTDTPGYPVDP